MRALLGGFAVSVLSTVAAHAAPINTFSNGSFESGQNPGSSFIEINAPDYGTTISSWNVTSGSIDYIGGYWQPENGSRSVDMAGSGPGTISQAFFTTPGQKYVVSFYIAGNPDGAPLTKSMDASVSSLGPISAVADPTFTFDASGKTRGNMGWTKASFMFTGSGYDNLVFTENTLGSPYGMALDNVSVNAVPLPSAAPMLGAALLGFATVGYGLKRRKVAAV